MKTERIYLNAEGQPIDRIEDAVGARVVFAGQNFDRIYEGAVPGAAITMDAIFGFHTKAGNVLNTALNTRGDTEAEAAEALREWMRLSESGQWRERAAEGTPRRGKRKYDVDVLAAVLVDLLGAAAKGDAAAYAAKLKEDKSFFFRVINHPDVLAEYTRRVGGASAPVALSDLA